MKHIYFDQNNEILWDSDEMDDDEKERYEWWRENRCYERWYDLTELTIYNSGKMVIEYYDNRDEEDTEEEID